MPDSSVLRLSAPRAAGLVQLTTPTLRGTHERYIFRAYALVSIAHNDINVTKQHLRSVQPWFPRESFSPGLDCRASGSTTSILECYQVPGILFDQGWIRPNGPDHIGHGLLRYARLVSCLVLFFPLVLLRIIGGHVECLDLSILQEARIYSDPQNQPTRIDCRA